MAFIMALSDIYASSFFVLYTCLFILCMYTCEYGCINRDQRTYFQVLSFCLVFEEEPHVISDGVIVMYVSFLLVLLSLSPVIIECWDYRWEPPHLVFYVVSRDGI